MDLLVELAASRLERAEGIETAVDLREMEVAEGLSLPSVAQDLILVLESSTKEDAVDMILDRHGLPPVEHPLTDEIPERTKLRRRGERFGNGVQSEQGGEGLGVELIRLQAGLGDQTRPVRIGEGRRMLL